MFFQLKWEAGMLTAKKWRFKAMIFDNLDALSASRSRDGESREAR
jgi:hypothetical protein